MKNRNETVAEDESVELRDASRRLLFGKREIPGSGQPADQVPLRHVRVKVTMNLDADLVDHFKKEAEKRSHPYQFLINQALREFIEGRTSERLAKEVGEVLLADKSFIAKIGEQLK